MRWRIGPYRIQERFIWRIIQQQCIWLVVLALLPWKIIIMIFPNFRELLKNQGLVSVVNGCEPCLSTMGLVLHDTSCSQTLTLISAAMQTFNTIKIACTCWWSTIWVSTINFSSSYKNQQKTIIKHYLRF